MEHPRLLDPAAQSWRYSTVLLATIDSDSDVSLADETPVVPVAALASLDELASAGTSSSAQTTRMAPPWVSTDTSRRLPIPLPGAQFTGVRGLPPVVSTDPIPASPIRPEPLLPISTSDDPDDPGIVSPSNSPDVELIMDNDALLAVNGLPLLAAEIGGRTVYFVDAEPSTSSGGSVAADRTILLLHAIPEGPHSSRKLLPLLVARGFRVIAPTLRGFNPGDPKPRVADAATRNAFYSWRAITAELVGLLNLLGLDRAIVTGYNFGCHVATSLALLYPSVVSKLILLSTPYIPPAATYIPPAMFAAKADPTLAVRLYLGSDRAISHFNEMPYCRPGGAEEFRRVAEMCRRVDNRTPDKEAEATVEELMKNPSSLFTAKETLLLVRWLDAIGGAGGMLQWHRVEANTVEEFRGVSREIQLPVLYIGAEFQPLSAGSRRADMRRLCPNLTEIILGGAGSWIAVERATETADLMADWIGQGWVTETVLSTMDVLEGGFAPFGSAQGSLISSM